MLGNPGEIIVVSKENEDLINNIKDYELSLGAKYSLPDPLVIKKLGIKADKECTVKINDRDFVIEENDVLEFGYGLTDIKSIVTLTADVSLVVRYLY